ncbi:hypothetical protein CBP51_03455 [Cellvibrio mixtus]|uniref:Uncharacterized protein n=1 Tax=Cellvibrio mixtus TaxID=39650 RepID=A0A266Q8F3_9GAMM|nr:hypothetical protein [Cellvibrio mixtus]OZY86100.1 hypothetical protein CBP51_03455 [Cellvibrio mixtus]
MKRFFFGGFIIFQSFFSMAGTTVETKITYVGVNSNNIVFFGVDKVIEEPGCPGDQIIIPPDSPIKEKILSVALTAKASGAPVQVRTKGCHLGKPAMLSDASDWGWLYIK